MVTILSMLLKLEVPSGLSVLLSRVYYVKCANVAPVLIAINKNDK